MFDAICARYDTLNRILSLGMDQGWRRKTVQALELSASSSVLDLATGTGDLALMIARTHPGATVLGTDPSGGMLEIAVEKAKAAGLPVRFLPGDAQGIDLDDASVDGVCIAFGIRNVPDRERALREMARVTRPGGRIAILELGEPRSGLLAPFARLHIRFIVPLLGALIGGAAEYAYLRSSVERFPPPDDFADLMRASGIEVLRVQPFSFGVVHLFVGTPARGAPAA